MLYGIYFHKHQVLLPKRAPSSTDRRRLAICTAKSSLGMASKGPITRLISFDVDGTLIRSVGNNANRLHREAFSAAFKEVFGLDTHIDVVHHHGSTDPLILLKVVVHHGIDIETAMQKLPEMERAMVDYFERHNEQAGDGLEILPGVENLLKILSQRPEVAICLVTGNLEPIGWAKMKALGLTRYFTQPHFGGFGSDFCSGNYEESWKDRSQFVRIAANKASQNLPCDLKVRAHVGDAPMDVQAAVAAGAIAIGVTTGIYTEDELLEVAPTSIVLQNLNDTERVLSILMLPAVDHA